MFSPVLSAPRVDLTVLTVDHPQYSPGYHDNEDDDKWLHGIVGQAINITDVQRKWNKHYNAVKYLSNRSAMIC